MNDDDDETTTTSENMKSCPAQAAPLAPISLLRAPPPASLVPAVLWAPLVASEPFPEPSKPLPQPLNNPRGFKKDDA